MTITHRADNLAGYQRCTTCAFVAMSCSSLAVDDHRRVTGNDDGCAMPTLWAGDLIADTSNAFAVGVSHDRSFDDNPAVIGLISKHDEWSCGHGCALH